MLSILAASLAILTLQQTAEELMPALQAAVAVLLTIAAVIGCFSVFVITRYYNVYVSELIAGAQVHFHIGLRSYEWYERLIYELKKANTKHIKQGKGEIHRREFLGQRTRSLNDSHFSYSLIISLIVFVCVAAALWLLFFTPFSST